MKIALLHYSSPPIVGGVESVLAQHARLMANAGHEVTILAGRGKPFDERISVRIFPRFDSRNEEVMAVKAALDKGQYLPAFDELRDKIKTQLVGELKGFDRLIAHNVASLNKNLALTAALHDAYSVKGFPKLILWHHDLACIASRYQREMYDGYPWSLLCTSWKGVTQVVVSELRRKELANLLGLHRESIHVIPNGVDVNTFFKLETQTVALVDKLCLMDADPLFLLPARLTPRKNIELALHILAHLRAQFPKATLVITGPEGPHNPANAAYRLSLLALRNKLNLEGAAYFLAEVSTGFIPDAVIADFYRLSDALLFPSLEEGFGIPLIEAAFSNIPVFCSNIPVLHELCGKDVTYFDPQAEPESIAKMIFERLQGEASSRWARRAKHNYSWNSIYKNKIGPLIEELGK